MNENTDRTHLGLEGISICVGVAKHLNKHSSIQLVALVHILDHLHTLWPLRCGFDFERSHGLNHRSFHLLNRVSLLHTRHHQATKMQKNAGEKQESIADLCNEYVRHLANCSSSLN